MSSANTPYVVSLAGSLTTPRAQATHATIVAALSDHDCVAIDCAGASEMDVSFVQLLVAAHRYALRRGKTVALASPPSGLVAETLLRCGFAPPKRPSAALDEVLSLPSM